MYFQIKKILISQQCFSCGELLREAKYMEIKGLVFKDEMVLILINSFKMQINYGPYSK